MAELTGQLNILIAVTDTVQAGLSVAAAEARTRTAQLDLTAADTASLSAQLSSFIGPAFLLPLDLAVADTVALPIGADVIVGPACFANLDVRTAANGLERSVVLDTAVAQALTLPASLDALTAESRNLPTKLSVTVSTTEQLTACLQLNVDSPGFSRLLTPLLSALVAEHRSCPVVLDVNIDQGVGRWALLNLLIQGRQVRQVDLDVNVKSPDLRFGASAVYNPEGDEVESLMFVADGDTLHPEWIVEMSATLLHRGEHDLGTVPFDCTYATGDGDVQAVWIHPAHTDLLSVRFVGTIDNCGDVSFTVPVGVDAPATQQFPAQLLEGVDNVAPRTEVTPFGSTTRQLDAAPEEIDVLDTDVLLTLLAVDLVSSDDPVATGTGPIDYQGGGNRLLPSLDNDGSFVFQPVGVLPHSIDGYTVVEPAGANLLDNTDFSIPTSATSAVPAGYLLTASSTITVLPTLEETGDINALKIRAFGSGPYVGPKSLTFERDGTVAVTPGEPITWSVLARIEFVDQSAADIPQTVVKVDTLRLTVSFRDAGDAEISQQVATFDAALVRSDDLLLLQNAVPSPPIGTVGVRVGLQLESIEASDDLNLYLMAPQVEEAASATSRMVGTGSVIRADDTIRLRQAGNIETRQGSFQIDFATNYNQTPPADSCLFDTRQAGQDGFALFHLQSGLLRFIVADSVGSVTLETPAAVSFGAGEPHSIVASWGTSLRSISVDGTELAVSSDPFALPSALGAWITIFATTELTARFTGIVTAIEIQREPAG